jgi:hypothetical protein
MPIDSNTIVEVKTEQFIATPAVEVATAEDLGFITRYAGYADVLEAPKLMHEIVATQIVATILNRNGVVIPHGALRYPLDLWTVLLSGSGLGRSTVANMAKQVLTDAKLPHLLRGADWGSLPAFYQDMAEHPSGLFVWGELSQKLEMMNNPQFGGLKQWLTDRYDDFAIPEPRRYRQTGRDTDTPAIQFPCSVRTNILATSSEDWFFNNLEEGDSAGGFLPRWMIVRSEGTGRRVPTPVPLDEAKAKELAFELEVISLVKGEADISRVLPEYEAWYHAAAKRFESQPNRALAEAYFNRHRNHVLKLAVIYEAARNYALTVTDSSWNHAVATGRELENTIFSLLTTGMNSLGFKQKKAEECIRDAGARGLHMSTFTRAFQHDPPRDREAWLRTLTDANVVKQVPRLTAGRTASILIHRDFCGEPVADVQPPEEVFA